MDVVATAGHVDHGKSTLIRALTGMEPDRWAEERRRGMTIDLGFAWTTLPTGRTIAFVDVPGHQRFLGNMLAGAGPAPAVLFVVAADEGWSRQSADHLAALHALGVGHGVIAVTKCDRADPAPAADRAVAELAATSLGTCATVAVSGATGHGLDELRTALDDMLAALPPPVTHGRVRLWVDRCFTIRGSGTVVTGTLTAGSLHIGDELAVSSTGDVARIRGLHALGEAVDSATAVSRVAINLRGVEPDSVRRGETLLSPDSWLSVDTVDVRLSAPAAQLPTHLIAHIGSAAVPARVRPLAASHARLHLAHALPLAVGDRFVLRDPGAQLIVAGATAVDVLVSAIDRRGAAAAVARVLEAAGDVTDVATEVDKRGFVRRDDLVRAGVLGDAAPPAGVIDTDGWLVSPTRWDSAQRALAGAVTAKAEASPLHPGLARDAAVRAAGLPDARLLDALVRSVPGLTIDGQGVHATRTASRSGADLPPAVARAVSTVTDRLTTSPFAAPEADELTALGLDASALAACVREGLLLPVGPGVYLLPDAPDRAVALLADAGPFTISQARQQLETTRRVAVPLLEHLDKAGRTRRLDGSLRVVVPDRKGTHGPRTH
ncbi:MAG: selenocysteine-specific translation elongation factor [Frankiales bacterium]|nr:selenocysteine-specific translation elongation factor [Frankiales bacterium]